MILKIPQCKHLIYPSYLLLTFLKKEKNEISHNNCLLTLAHSINQPLKQLRTLKNPESTIIRQSLIIQDDKNRTTKLQRYHVYNGDRDRHTTPKKRLHFDTGSHILWVASPTCLTCKNLPRFEIGSSSTYKNIGIEQQLPYIGGNVSGVMVKDVVKFEKRQAQQMFLLIDEVDQSFHSFGDFQVSGIIGLGKTDDLMQIFYGLNFFDNSHFAIELGSSKFNQKSYLYYNLSEEDFPNAKYFKMPDEPNFWQIHVERFQANSQKLDAQSFVIDSGSSVSSFKKQLYQEIHTKYFEHLCKQLQIYQPQQMILRSKTQKKLYQCDCDFSKYPTFKLIYNQTTLDFSPFMYMLEYEDMCILNIKQMKEEEINILGDDFIRHYTIVFDSYNNRIGFVEKEKIKPYVSDSTVILGVQMACILIILTTARIFFTGKHMHLIYDNFKVSSSNVFETGTGVMIGSSYDD